METQWAKCESRATGYLDGRSIDGMVDSEETGKLIISCLAQWTLLNVRLAIEVLGKWKLSPDEAVPGLETSDEEDGVDG